jgi:hypothetical protein
MTLAQLEERMIMVEREIAELRRLSQGAESRPATLLETEIIPGTETPIVLSKPPAETIRLEAVIKWVHDSESQGLGLSAEEWASLGLEEDNG